MIDKVLQVDKATQSANPKRRIMEDGHNREKRIYHN